MIIERKSTILAIVFHRLTTNFKIKIKYIILFLRYWKSLDRIKLNKNSKQGKKLLVIGNGISSLALENLKINTLNIEILVLNGYYKTSLAKKIKPNYYLISDPGYFDQTNKNSPIKDLDLRQYCVQSYASMIVPIQYYGKDEIADLGFCDIYDPYARFTTDVLKPYNHLSMSAFKALRMGLYLGYDEIGFIGLDNDYVSCLEVDRNNRVSYLVPHTVEEKRIYVDEDQNNDVVGNNIGRFIYHESFIFLDLDDFPAERIVNLNLRGLITSFRKVDPKVWCDRGEI